MLRRKEPIVFSVLEYQPNPNATDTNNACWSRPLDQDVVFAISSTGIPQELLDSAVIARQYGATSICLTRPNSPLVDVCDIALVIDSPVDDDMYKPTASRLVFTAVLDVLATGVAISRPKETREMLRRIRSSLVVVQDSTKPQPVGD